MLSVPVLKIIGTCVKFVSEGFAERQSGNVKAVAKTHAVFFGP